MVFQSYALYPHMTIRENLEFGLKIRKTPQGRDGQARERGGRDARHHAAPRPQAEAALRRAAPARRRRARHRAQARRSSSSTSRSRTSTPSSASRCAPRSPSSSNRLKTTTVYVTHDQVEAMTMGHRIAVMKDGKLQQVGTPLEVYEQPANLFVANFIGTPPMNFVQATLADGGTTLKTATFSLPVAQAYRALTAGKDGQGGHRRDPPREPQRRQPPRRGECRPDPRDRRGRRAARPRGPRPRPGRRRRPDRRQGRPAPRPDDRRRRSSSSSSSRPSTSSTPRPNAA